VVYRSAAHPGATLGNQSLQSLRHGVLQGRGLSRPGDASEIQARHTADRIVSSSPSAPIAPVQASGKAAGGAGEPLATGLRAYFEPRFGASLDHVRVRHDPSAAREALALDARAFTAGNVISFAHGQYAPQSSDGLHLLAHELAHVTSDAGSNTLHRETWDIDDAGRSIEREILVQLNFEDTPADHLLGNGWTSAHRTTFRTQFENNIETSFNNTSIIIRPPQAYADVLPQENIDQGYKPLVDIQLVPDDEWSWSEDWTVDVSSNPNREDRTSSSDRSHGTLDEDDNRAVRKRSSAPGVTQIPAVHEFGHFIGLHHPGHGLDAAARNPSGGSEYAHSGTDEYGHDVNGPTDLLGGGMGMRAFYFDEWARALDNHVAELRRQQAREGFLRDIEEWFSPRPPMGDFPTPPPGGPHYG
jgi:hypothetical protein